MKETLTSICIAASALAGANALAQDDSCFRFGREGRERIIGYGRTDDGSCPTDVVIPTGTTSIGSYAFDDKSLTSLVLPEGVTSIGSYAFSHNNLTTLVLPQSLASVSANAFRYNRIGSIVIKNSSISIGRRAFDDNPTLASVCVEADGTGFQIPDSFGNASVRLSENGCP